MKTLPGLNASSLQKGEMVEPNLAHMESPDSALALGLNCAPSIRMKSELVFCKKGVCTRPICTRAACPNSFAICAPSLLSVASSRIFAVSLSRAVTSSVVFMVLFPAARDVAVRVESKLERFKHTRTRYVCVYLAGLWVTPAKSFRSERFRASTNVA